MPQGISFERIRRPNPPATRTDSESDGVAGRSVTMMMMSDPPAPQPDREPSSARPLRRDHHVKSPALSPPSCPARMLRRWCRSACRRRARAPAPPSTAGGSRQRRRWWRGPRASRCGVAGGREASNSGQWVNAWHTAGTNTTVPYEDAAWLGLDVPLSYSAN
jgi:hypothetical protein